MRGEAASGRTFVATSSTGTLTAAPLSFPSMSPWASSTLFLRREASLAKAREAGSNVGNVSGDRSCSRVCLTCNWLRYLGVLPLVATSRLADSATSEIAFRTSSADVPPATSAPSASRDVKRPVGSITTSSPAPKKSRVILSI